MRNSYVTYTFNARRNYEDTLTKYWCTYFSLPYVLPC